MAIHRPIYDEMSMSSRPIKTKAIRQNPKPSVQKSSAVKRSVSQVAKQVLGFQIRDLRRAKGITITELAQNINRSVGWLSQIERGMAEVNISAMHEIANALEVQISWFFRGGQSAAQDELGLVVRQANRRIMDFHGSGVHEEILSPTISGELLLVESTFAPGASTGDRDRERRGEEAGVVLSGSLELHVDGKALLLNAGDSFAFTRRGPHRCHNPGHVPAVVLWVHTPASY
jgi:transcriptional regulator with XRE-family HTH domain